MSRARTVAAVVAASAAMWIAYALTRDRNRAPDDVAILRDAEAVDASGALPSAITDASDEPAIPATCADIAADANATIEKLVKARPECATFVRNTLAPMNACVDATWTFSIDRLALSPDPNGNVGACGLLDIQYSLVHVGRGGAALAPPDPAFAMREFAFYGLRDAGFEVREVSGGNLSAPKIALAFDYDGDGAREIALTFDVGAVEWGATSTTLWTFRDGHVEPYGPAREIIVGELVDVDGDGRPDIRTRGPYSGQSTFYAELGDPILPPMFIAHSLADGTFSFDDAVARAETKKSCPKKPDPLAHDDGGGPYWGWSAPWGVVVVCSRVWGASAKEAESAVSKFCDEREGDVRRCLAPIRRLAAIAPPIRLP